MALRPRDRGKETRAAPYLAPYERAVARHGPSFEATLWASRESQQARFLALAQMTNLSGRVVIDVGSGCGDFADFLASRAVKPARYVGVEGVAEVAHAACCTPRTGTEFITADFVADEGLFDRLAATAAGHPLAILFSGSLNTLNQKEALRVLGRAWESIGRLEGSETPAGEGSTLAFNFLSSRCDPLLRREDHGPARRFDPIDMLDWAFARSHAVSFRTDYLPLGHDATIVMSTPGAP